MIKRITDKIAQLEQYIGELDQITPPSLHLYLSSLEKKAACERYVEKIVEAATDLAFMVIKNSNWRLPEDDADAFAILLENNIGDTALVKKLQNAKGMRNVIAHQYSKIDDEIVFLAITDELGADMREFLKTIRHAFDQNAAKNHPKVLRKK